MEQYGSFDVRLADEGDVEQVARVQVAAWSEIDSDHLPDRALASLTVEDLVDRWSDELEPLDDREAWIASHEDDPVGFAVFGQSRDDETAASTGELYGLYVHPDQRGGGIGSGLQGIAAVRMRTMGFEQTDCWLFEANSRTRAYYEAAGWETTDDCRTESWRDIDVDMVRYRRPLYD